MLQHSAACLDRLEIGSKGRFFSLGWMSGGWAILNGLVDGYSEAAEILAEIDQLTCADTATRRIFETSAFNI